MSDRGQSALDFLLGTVIFLLAVIVVVTFVPGMLDPFATETASHPVVADRAASTLAAEQLPTDGEPYLTTASRVDTVINSQSAAELKATLAVPDAVHLNVTLENDTATLGQAGTSPPGTESVTAARRTVSVDGQPATLVVRVW